MSNTTSADLVKFTVGYALASLAVGLIVLTVLSCVIGLLVPVATSGTTHIGFIQGVSIITLAVIGRLVLFPSAKSK